MVDHLKVESVATLAPVVSVAMPIYNAGVHLRLAVLSIIKQSFTSWELLIIDDGSTDNALKSIEDLLENRIKIFSDGQNRGLAARLNQACEIASGTYLARMDQDDVSYPERLMLQVRALQNDPQLDLVAARTVTIDETDKIIGMFPFAATHEKICARPWRGFFFPHPAWMGRLKWFRLHRYADPAPYFCEDQELLLRTFQQSRFFVLDEVLLGYRIRFSVNWIKLARTRRALLSVQLKFFSDTGMWMQTLLSLGDYTLKRFAGLLRLNRSFYTPGRSGVSANVAAEWNTTLLNCTVKQPGNNS